MPSKLTSLAEKFIKVVKQFPELRYAGDPILRRRCRKVSCKKGVIVGKKLGSTLLRYRKLAGYGRGLAAPQLGINASVFVTYVDDVIQIFINPRIVWRSKSKNSYREVCLSAGVMAADVKRSEKIKMFWTDESGKRVSGIFDSFLSRLYQHEEAHLRGFINLDEAKKGGIELMLFDPLKEKLR